MAASAPAPPTGAAEMEAAMLQLLVSHTQTSMAARVQLKEALRQPYCAAALLFLVQHSQRVEVRRRAGGCILRSVRFPQAAHGSPHPPFRRPGKCLRFF